VRLQRFGHQFAGRRVVGGDHCDGLDGGGVTYGLRDFAKARDDRLHRDVDPFAELDRGDVSVESLKALLDDGVGEHCGGGGAVAGDLIGLLRNLADDLGTHVLKGVLKLDLGRDADTVARNDGCADGHVDDGVAALGTQRRTHGTRERGYTAPESGASLVLKQHHLRHGGGSIAARGSNYSS
jgi:hypothetical protein